MLMQIQYQVARHVTKWVVTSMKNKHKEQFHILCCIPSSCSLHPSLVNLSAFTTHH
jgi:hypothetical protein